MSKSSKLRAQVKSRFYYIFWGIATTSVVLGQIYVGTGYREMKRGVDGLTNVFVTMLRLV